MNGGYVMIDCTGLDLTKGSTEQTINGLYNKVQTAMKSNKPIYAYNAIWGTGKPITPIQVFVIQFDGYVICTSSTLQIILTSSDVVTINNLVS